MTESDGPKGTIGDVFSQFCETISALRHPESGCPWDLEQDHLSLRRYMLEEAYEAVEAASSGDDKELLQELGDVLLQVILNAQIAQDRGAFDVVAVVNSINDKMRRRHPHVFGTKSERQNRSLAQIKESWQKIKDKEQGNENSDRFAKARKVRPALSQGAAIGRKTTDIGFDWPNASGALDQVLSEITELREAHKDGCQQAINSELGDVFFSLAQYCRHLGHDPEVLAQEGNQKFLKRFEKMEALAEDQQIAIDQAEPIVLEELWQQAKLLE